MKAEDAADDRCQSGFADGGFPIRSIATAGMHLIPSVSVPRPMSVVDDSHECYRCLFEAMDSIHASTNDDFTCMEQEKVVSPEHEPVLASPFSTSLLLDTAENWQSGMLHGCLG